MELSLRNHLEKCAFDQGFSTLLGESDGWLMFKAHAVPSRLALSRYQGDIYLVGTSHRGIGQELGDVLEPAPVSHEEFDCFMVPNTSELFRIIGRIWTLSRSLPHEPLARFEKLVREAPSTTEVERIRKERVGQDVFRQALMDYWDSTCSVTGIGNPALLRASHIIPWAKCESDEERLNVHNGLLLVATLDAAFDSGLISFADSGEIIISQRLEPDDCSRAAIDRSLRLRNISTEHQTRLQYHRENIFK